METTVRKHAIIVNAKLVPQKMVYVQQAVYLDGRLTNVIKVFNNAFNILIFYFLSRRCHKNIDIRN